MGQNAIYYKGKSYSGGGGGGGTEVIANPEDAATDTLTKLSVDGDVYEIPEINVEDVHVNGTSVLDINKIAQIKSYQEITKAEYDALPSSKLTDDILYCITDGGATKPGEYYNPVIYSTTEREVGVWMDGKPLYQKTVKVTSIARNVWNSYLVDADAVIKNIDGWYGDANNRLPLNYFTGSVMMNRTSDHADGYFSLYGSGTLATAIVTVQYTKTTDVAGSGEYNTLAIPNVHYSTDEQVIGTWIDGKTLYQKTKIFPNTIAFSNDTVLDMEIVNVDTIFVEEGYFYDFYGNAIGKLPYSQDGNLAYTISVKVDISNKSHLKISSNTTFGVNSDRYIAVTVRYTKTTD